MAKEDVFNIKVILCTPPCSESLACLLWACVHAPWPTNLETTMWWRSLVFSSHPHPCVCDWCSRCLSKKELWVSKVRYFDQPKDLLKLLIGPKSHTILSLLWFYNSTKSKKLSVYQILRMESLCMHVCCTIFKSFSANYPTLALSVSTRYQSCWNI